MFFKKLTNVLAHSGELKSSLKISSDNELALSLFSLSFVLSSTFRDLSVRSLFLLPNIQLCKNIPVTESSGINNIYDDKGVLLYLIHCGLKTRLLFTLTLRKNHHSFK